MSYIRPVSYPSAGLGANVAAAAPQGDGFTQALNNQLKVPNSMDRIFEEASQRYQVPVSLLKAVAKAESDFNPNAVSHAGAQGVMQLMPATARELGVSNSFDPYENIMGGAKYLGQMLRKYDGDVKLALAAYNAGSNNVDKYGGVPPFEETQNYVVKVMKYAGSGSLQIPSGVSSDSLGRAGAASYDVSMDSSYRMLLESILNFDGYSTDDYLLFLELLKGSLGNLGTSAVSSDASGGQLYGSEFFSQRIQTLY